MVNKKLTLLAKILEEEQLHKMAQEAGVPEGEVVDEATADRLAQEIFNKLYDEELKKLIQS
jgi:hypothetical protein